MHKSRDEKVSSGWFLFLVVPVVFLIAMAAQALSAMQDNDHDLESVFVGRIVPPSCEIWCKQSESGGNSDFLLQ